MKKLFMVVIIMALALVGGVSAGIGFMAGRETKTEETIIMPTDEDLVKMIAIENLGEGEYEILITEDEGDGYIDYFVYEDGDVVMCGYTNREVTTKRWKNHFDALIIL